MSTPNFKGLKLFAHRIDEQLCDIIHKQLVKVFEELESGLSEKYKPESQAAVMFIFYMCSLYLDRPTPGRRNNWNLLFSHATIVNAIFTCYFSQLNLSLMVEIISEVAH